jgi:hypothetical protein
MKRKKIREPKSDIAKEGVEVAKKMMIRGH